MAASTVAESLLYKKEGKVIQKNVLENVLNNAGGSTGSARIVDGAFKILQKTDPLDVTTVSELMSKELLNVPMMFWLSSRKPPDDEMQPKIMLEDEDDPILICFYEGEVDFDAFQAIVDDILDKNGNDLVKSLKVLNGPAARAEITAKVWSKKVGNTTVLQRAHITLMDITGGITNFKNNSTFEEFDWGWTSNAYHPPKPDVKPVTSVPAVGAKLTPQERIKRRQALEASSASGQTDDLPLTKPVAPPDTGTPLIPGVGPQPDTKIPDGAGADTMITLGPPPAHLNNSQKRSWWISQIGECPPNYKKATVSIAKSKISKKEAHVPTEVAAQSKAVEQAVVTDIHTVLAPNIIEAIIADFSKYTVQTAVERDKFDKKYPNWTIQLGKHVPIEATFGWSHEKFRELAVKYPHGIAVLAYEITSLYMQALSDMEKATDIAPPTKLTPAERIARKNKAA